MTYDVMKTIEPKSDQLNADDLLVEPRTITVTKVGPGRDGDTDMRIDFQGDKGKPWYPCKSVRRILVSVWGKNVKRWVGQSVTVYRDPDVMYAGVKVGGIRVSHMTGVDKKKQIVVTESRNKKKLITIEPLKEQPKPDPELKKQGDDAAAKGVEAYKEWIGSLSEEQKEPLKQYHSQWTKIAKEVVSDDDGWE